MADVLPPELARLLTARDASSREAAWSDFLAVHSPLLVKVARTRASYDHDLAMDAYAYVIEQLRRDDYRRLRSYVADARSTFTTWLVIVARRLCVDFARQRYGRPGRRDADPDELRQRRRLVDLAAEEIDLRTIADPSGVTPESELDAALVSEELSDLLRTLPPRDRLLLALRFEDGLTAERIATSLQFPSVFHVYRQLTRVLTKLRTALEQRRKTSRLVR